MTDVPTGPVTGPIPGAVNEELVDWRAELGNALATVAWNPRPALRGEIEDFLALLDNESHITRISPPDRTGNHVRVYTATSATSTTAYIKSMTKSGLPLDDRAYIDICLPGLISDEHVHNIKGNDEQQVFLGNHPKLARVRARDAYEKALGATSACVYAWYWDHRPHRIKLGKTTKGLGRWTDVPGRHTDIDPDEWAEMMGERERVHVGFVDLPIEQYGVAETRLLAAFDCLPGSEWVEASGTSVLAVLSLIAEVYDGTLHTPTPDAVPPV